MASYWCHPSQDTGRFGAPIQYAILPEYVHEVRGSSTELPRWFRFTVQVRTTNGFGAPITQQWWWWVVRNDAGQYRLIGECDSADCVAAFRMGEIMLRAGPPDVYAACRLPRDEPAAAPQ